LRILIDKRLQKQFFSPPSSTDGNAILLHVILSEFASWCIYKGYDIPEELAELAKNLDTDTVVKGENKQAKPTTTKAEERKSSLEILADGIADTIRMDETPVSLNAVCKELRKQGVRNKNRELLFGQKGWHEVSWLKVELKGWKDPILK